MTILGWAGCPDRTLSCLIARPQIRMWPSRALRQQRGHEFLNSAHLISAQGEDSSTGFCASGNSRWQPWRCMLSGFACYCSFFSTFGHTNIITDSREDFLLRCVTSDDPTTSRNLRCSGWLCASPPAISARRWEHHPGVFGSVSSGECVSMGWGWHQRIPAATQLPPRATQQLPIPPGDKLPPPPPPRCGMVFQLKVFLRGLTELLLTNSFSLSVFCEYISVVHTRLQSFFLAHLSVLATAEHLSRLVYNPNW